MLLLLCFSVALFGHSVHSHVTVLVLVLGFRIILQDQYIKYLPHFVTEPEQPDRTATQHHLQGKCRASNVTRSAYMESVSKVRPEKSATEALQWAMKVTVKTKSLLCLPPPVHG